MGIMPPRIKVVDQDLQIVPQAVACLELIGRHDMVLATGHLGRDEIYALVRVGARDENQAESTGHAR